MLSWIVLGLLVLGLIPMTAGLEQISLWLGLESLPWGAGFVGGAVYAYVAVQALNAYARWQPARTDGGSEQ